MDNIPSSEFSVPHNGTPIRIVHLIRSSLGYGFTISGQKPCLLRYIVEASPADRAGLRPGNFLVGVNGRDVSHLAHDDVVTIIGSCNTTGSLRLHVADSYFVSESPKDGDEELQPEQQTRLRAEAESFTTYQYQAVVGYIGSVEIPQVHENKRLQALSACVRKLRQEKRVRSILLLRILSNGISLFSSNQKFVSNNGAPIAFYSFSSIVFCGAYGEDRRFFGLVTVSPSTSSRKNNKDSYSCHVFMVEPKLISHLDHSRRALCFTIQCTPLSVPKSGQVLGVQECAEFPATVDSILNSIMWRLHSFSSSHQDQAITPQRSHSKARDREKAFRSSMEIKMSPVVVVDQDLSKSNTLNGASTVSMIPQPDGSVENLPNNQNQVPNPLESKNENNIESSTPAVHQELKNSSDEVEWEFNGLKLPSSSPKMEENKGKKWADSIENLLSDPEGFQVFTKFLELEFSVENINFYTDCLMFKEGFSLLNQPQRFSTASTIFQKYLQNEGATDPVNVDFQARNQCEKALYQIEPTQDMFDSALAQIYNLLKFDCYPRFLRSNIFRDLTSSSSSPPVPEAGDQVDSNHNQEFVKPCKLDFDGRRRSLFPWNIKKNKADSRKNTIASLL